MKYINDDNGELVYVGEAGFAPLGEEARCMREEDASSLKAIVRGGSMPVVSPIVYHGLGLTSGRPYEDYTPLNPDADDIARVVAHFSEPEWLIFVTENAANLSIDLERAKWHMRSQRALEVVRGISPGSAKLQEHYRNADWKIAAAVTMSVNGHNVAVVTQQNLLPFLLSKPKHSGQYSSAALNASFGKQLQKERLKMEQEVLELGKIHPSARR